MSLGRFMVFSALFIIARTFAQQPPWRVIWSMQSGQLESREAHAVITALVADDSIHEGRRTRGIRIDFSWAGKHSTIYVDGSLLKAQKKIFDDLSRDIESSALHNGINWGFIGSCEFRSHPEYPLVANYNYSGPEAPALWISGPEGHGIPSPERTPRDLANLLGHAMDDLKAH